MKLHNPRNQMVRIKIPKHRFSLELRPNETIPIDRRTRKLIAPFIADFGLKLEAEEIDYHKSAVLSNPKDSPSVDQDGITHVLDPVIDEPEPSVKEMEDLLFTKGMEETGQTETETGKSGENRGNEGGGDGSGDDASGSVILATEEGSDGETEEIQDSESNDRVPETCPYTKSELTLKVKSELWEICETLGLEIDGTKNDLIQRIFSFYGEK